MSEPEAPSLGQKRVELAALMMRLAPNPGLHLTGVAGLQLMRADAPTLRRPSLYQPSLCVVVQGSKRSIVGAETYFYDPLNYLTITVTLPAVSQVIEASPDRPYLSLLVELEARLIAELLLQMGTGAPPGGGADRGLFISRVNLPLLEGVLRLVRLSLEPQRDVAILAPLAMREIHYRLLMGESGDRLRLFCASDSQAHRVSRVIDLLRKRFPESLSIEDLAAAAYMSESSLHHRFKAVTAMSPMQFQKHLRLHEARRLMLAEGIEAAAAAQRVGYESPSHFSREYRRLFGAPPHREVKAVRGVRLRRTAARPVR